jgi:Tfp pilus assembly protein PilF
LGIGATYAQMNDYEKAEDTLRTAIADDPDNRAARLNLALVCLARRNRDCALSQYNRLKMMDHSLGKTLFTTIFRDRVVDASRYKNP